MVVTGTYSDSSIKEETITVDNVTGFDSSAVVAEQILTVTVDGKTTTYKRLIFKKLKKKESILLHSSNSM
jgi:hypothetical protein